LQVLQSGVEDFLKANKNAVKERIALLEANPTCVPICPLPVTTVYLLFTGRIDACVRCSKKSLPEVRRRSWQLCAQHTFVVYHDDFQYESGSLSNLLRQVYTSSKRARGQRATLWSLKCEYDYRIIFHEATNAWFAHLPRPREPVPPLLPTAVAPRIAAIDPNGSNFMAIYSLHGAWVIGQVRLCSVSIGRSFHCN
jgi:hypothetical protein